MITNRSSSLFKKLLVPGLLGMLVCASGCGPEFSRVSELETLRILGFKKSAPYARPGEDVKVQLFWEDARDGKPRKVERFIGFWCINPAGDLFSECLSGAPSAIPNVAFDEDELTIKIPENSIRPSNVDPAAPPYGIAYVFYAVCAGTFGTSGGGGIGGAGGAGGALGTPTPGGSKSGAGIPTCYTKDGKLADSDDYVVGYSSIFIYDDFRNENPKVTGFTVNGKDVAFDCIGDACVGKPFAPPELDGCVPGVACLEACKDDGGAACPGIVVEAKIDESSAEKDSISAAAYGENYEEALWVNYFVDRGAVTADVRLVNDATTGWNPNHDTKILAPKKKGPMRIWATVRDNRGGVEWIRIPAYVK